jgi:hypothetical protein
MTIMASRPMILIDAGDTKKTQCDTMTLIVYAFLETNTKITTEETTTELMEAHFVQHTMCETKALCKVGNIMTIIAATTKIPEILDLAPVSAMFRPSPEQRILLLNTWASSIQGLGEAK